MKALAINGSPHKTGNTEILLREVLKPLDEAGWETECVHVGAGKVKGCIACYKCFESRDKRCAVTNDALNGCLEKILEADAVIIGTPTYFSDVTAEIKGLIDRTGLVAVANGGLLYGKIGAAVVAVRRGGATHAFDSINHMFMISGVIVPGSSYWNMGYGLHPGEVSDDAEAMGNMRHLGQAIACVGKAMQPYVDAYPKMPALAIG